MILGHNIYWKFRMTSISKDRNNMQNIFILFFILFVSTPWFQRNPSATNWMVCINTDTVYVLCRLCYFSSLFTIRCARHFAIVNGKELLFLDFEIFWTSVTLNVVVWSRAGRRCWNEHVSKMGDERFAKTARNGKPATISPPRYPKRLNDHQHLKRSRVNSQIEQLWRFVYIWFY